jgi:Protein kinase domain
MELVEGDTLAARLKRGRLPMEQTTQYGAQIASALSAAHTKGIVHRDLTPGNVMVTKVGVKVLDFGLAKSAQDETLTMANAVMGTPAYMAPEQREGKACDERTDIYALGLVLSEMATGSRARPGEQPQLDSLPEKFAHVVKLCLAHDPDERWQSTRDVKSELEWIRDAGAETSEARAGAAGVWHVGLPWALFAAALAFSAFAWLHGAGARNTAEAEPVRFEIPLAKELTPDGRSMIFNVAHAGEMADLDKRPIDGAGDGTGVNADNVRYQAMMLEGHGENLTASDSVCVQRSGRVRTR